MTSGTSGHMETLSEAMGRMRAGGYVELWVAEGGRLRCVACDEAYELTDVAVDEVVRFEGPTDPGDEAILFALTGPCGHLGQYSAAYGPYATSDDAPVIAALAQR